jgi:hypothetical protein
MAEVLIMAVDSDQSQDNKNPDLNQEGDACER